MTNTLNWFEIPTKDISRACKFYGAVLGHELIPENMGPFKMAVMSPVEGAVTGALVEYEEYIPSDKAGPLLYLNGGDDLQPMLDRAAAAGAKIVQPKTQISPEVGYMAIFIDTEGNRMAIHSAPE